MSTVAETRAAIAAAVSAVDGVNVKAYAVTNNVRPGDGWVASPVLGVADFEAATAEWDVVIVLGADPTKGEQRFDELALQVLDAAAALDAADVSVTPTMLPAGDGQPATLYALVLTLTTEVTSA